MSRAKRDRILFYSCVQTAWIMNWFSVYWKRNGKCMQNAQWDEWNWMAFPCSFRNDSTHRVWSEWCAVRINLIAYLDMLICVLLCLYRTQWCKCGSSSTLNRAQLWRIIIVCSTEKCVAAPNRECGDIPFFSFADNIQFLCSNVLFFFIHSSSSEGAFLSLNDLRHLCIEWLMYNYAVCHMHVTPPSLQRLNFVAEKTPHCHGTH